VKPLTENVVDAAGQPLPGPLRFCRVIREVTMRAAFDWFELSVGNETRTLGLLTALPAATFLFRACEGTPGYISVFQRGTNRVCTLMKVFLSGGQAQGILTTWPAAFMIPSQSPVPVGFTPG
jgi:hypothetical protein